MIRGSGRWRHWKYWALPLTALAGGAVVLAVTVLPADSATKTGPCDLPTTGRAHPVAAPTPGLQVVDKGFTVLPAAHTVSLGAIVHNTSPLVAYHTRVRISVYDQHHDSAANPRSGELLDQIIPVILPGQRIGIGAWTYLRQTPSTRPVPVAGFDVNLQVEQWWPPHNRVHLFGSITTRHLTTTRDSTGPEDGELRYTVTSTLCRPIASRGTITVFRDATGRLVGGTFDTFGPRTKCGTGRYTEHAGAFRSLPPNIDDTRTQTFLYCDPALADPAPIIQGDPFNY